MCFRGARKIRSNMRIWRFGRSHMLGAELGPLAAGRG